MGSPAKECGLTFPSRGTLSGQAGFAPLNSNTTVGHSTIDLLTSYDWPGNVRELQNVIQRSVILREGADLPAQRRLRDMKSQVAAREPFPISAT